VLSAPWGDRWRAWEWVNFWDLVQFALGVKGWPSTVFLSRSGYVTPVALRGVLLEAFPVDDSWFLGIAPCVDSIFSSGFSNLISDSSNFWDFPEFAIRIDFGPSIPIALVDVVGQTLMWAWVWCQIFQSWGSGFIAELGDRCRAWEWVNNLNFVQLALWVKGWPSTVLFTRSGCITPVAHIGVILEALPVGDCWFLGFAPICNIFWSGETVNLWDFIKFTFHVKRRPSSEILKATDLVTPFTHVNVVGQALVIGGTWVWLRTEAVEIQSSRKSSCHMKIFCFVY
jgi:hypothetical protein